MVTPVVTNYKIFSMCMGASVKSSNSKLCNAGMVKMSHVDDAINEMFQATHMQMMRNCCRLEKMLLASIHMESRAKGKPMHEFTMICHVSLQGCMSKSKLSHMHSGAQRDKHCNSQCLQGFALHDVPAGCLRQHCLVYGIAVEIIAVLRSHGRDDGGCT